MIVIPGQASSNKQQATSTCDILSHDNMHCDNVDNLKIYKKVYNTESINKWRKL